jgi:hypothetical protein
LSFASISGFWRLRFFGCHPSPKAEDLLLPLLLLFELSMSALQLFFELSMNAFAFAFRIERGALLFQYPRKNKFETVARFLATKKPRSKHHKITINPPQIHHQKPSRKPVEIAKPLQKHPSTAQKKLLPLQIFF